jgi:hypothetical protein
MIMLQRSTLSGHHPQAARHPQVDQQAPRLKFDQNVFAAPTHGTHNLPRQPFGEIFGHRIAQPRLAHTHLRNRLPLQGGLDSTARDLNFGQFGHPLSFNLRQERVSSAKKQRINTDHRLA